jgi:hypothetical protein
MSSLLGLYHLQYANPAFILFIIAVRCEQQSLHAGAGRAIESTAKITDSK